LGHNIDTKKMTPDGGTEGYLWLRHGSAVILAGHLTEFTPSQFTSTEMK
jgi:hypothetical protein